MAIKNRVLCSVLMVMLAGCGDSGEIKGAVKAQLKDPESAHFSGLVISKGGSLACIEYNAKNGYGGYGDSSLAELQKVDSKWAVLTMEQKAVRCTEEGLQAQEDGAKAEADFQHQAIKRLKELGKIAPSSKGSDGPCGGLVWFIGFNAKSIAGNKVTKSSNELYEKNLAKALAMVEAGDCSANFDADMSRIISHELNTHE
jgi:hypothetical protein